MSILKDSEEVEHFMSSLNYEKELVFVTSKSIDNIKVDINLVHENVNDNIAIAKACESKVPEGDGLFTSKLKSNKIYLYKSLR